MNDVNPYEPPSEADASEVSSTNSAKSPSFYSRLGWGMGGALLGSYFAFFPYLLADQSAKRAGALLDPSTASDFLPCCLLCTVAVVVFAGLSVSLNVDMPLIFGALAVALMGNLLFAAFWTWFEMYWEIGSKYLTAAVVTALVASTLAWYQQQLKQNQRKRPG